MSTKTKPMTELRDADIRRVDAVKGAANGTRFLIAKSAAETGLIPAEVVRDLIAEIPPDTYLDAAGQIVKGEMPAKKRKDKAMTADEAADKPAFPGAKASFKNLRKEARAVLKQAKLAKTEAKLAKRADRLAKRAVLAKVATALPTIDLAKKKKGLRSSLAAAQQSVLDALKNEANEGDQPPEVLTQLQSLADDIGSLMSDRVANPPAGDVSADDSIAKMSIKKARAIAKAERQEKRMTLKKARRAATAVRLEKRTAKDRIDIARAEKTLTKISRRSVKKGAAPAILLQKNAVDDDQVAAVIDTIAKAVGPLIGADLEAIRGELAQVSEQIAKVAKIPMPGGPRVLLERDGSLIGAPDGANGLSFEQAALAKVAERYPVGSVVREELQKAAATSAIKELMVARSQY